MAATTITWIYAAHLERAPARRYASENTTEFAFADARRIPCQAPRARGFRYRLPGSRQIRQKTFDLSCHGPRCIGKTGNFRNEKPKCKTYKARVRASGRSSSDLFPVLGVAASCSFAVSQEARPERPHRVGSFLWAVFQPHTPRTNATSQVPTPTCRSWAAGACSCGLQRCGQLLTGEQGKAPLIVHLQCAPAAAGNAGQGIVGHHAPADLSPPATSDRCRAAMHRHR